MLPAMRPNTTKSHTALPPMRLPPCTPPVVSPAAYRPGMMLPSVSSTCASALTRLPPGRAALPGSGWRGQTLLLQNQTQRQGQYILQELRSRRLHPAEILESSNIRAAAALAANGYGIGFLSGELLEHLNNAVPFNAFSLRDCTLPLESVAAWRAGNYLPRYALAFIERMEQLENQKCNNSATKAH